MTSLLAQTQFGNLIDCSRRQPVAVTRHGRPVAVVLSYEEYMGKSKTISWEVAQLISESYPLRGEAASTAMTTLLSTMSQLASEEGLDERGVMRMLGDE